MKMAQQKSVPLISPGLFGAPRITAQRKLPQVVLFLLFFPPSPLKAPPPPPGYGDLGNILIRFGVVLFYLGREIVRLEVGGLVVNEEVVHRKPVANHKPRLQTHHFLGRAEGNLIPCLPPQDMLFRHITVFLQQRSDL